MNLVSAIVSLLYLAMTYGLSTYSEISFLHNRGSTLTMSMQQGRVTMYRKLSCPFCQKASSLLEGIYALKVSYVDVEEPDQ